MNKFLLPLVALLTLAAWSQLQTPDVSSAERPNSPTVEVWGTAEILTPASSIEFQVNITTRQSSQKAALAENDRNLANLEKLLGEFDIVTTSFNINNVRTYDDRRHDSARPQVVNRQISFDLADPAQKDELLKRFAAAKIGEVGSSTPHLADPITVRDQARTQALRVARDKAQAMAGALGEKVGRPHTITEVQSNRWSNTASNMVTSSGDDSQSVKRGQISTKATVKVVFLLQP